MSLNSQADSLVSLNFDDMRPAPAATAPATDHTTYRLFDGQVFEIAGRKEADKAYITDHGAPRRRARGAVPGTATGCPAAAPAAPAANPAPAAPAPAPAAPAADQTSERLAARAKGLEFEIPLYKYESLFRHLEDMLEPKDAGRAPATRTRPVVSLPARTRVSACARSAAMPRPTAPRSAARPAPRDWRRTPPCRSRARAARRKT